ncbi:MAG TPA: heavy-metal-associated domain-containing protein [Allosphingosinicella sp.]|nr:heavy-metal-associated domain-containing protein [Allosphingosinicella sp.]
MALSLMLGGSAMRAQLDGTNRGIDPYDSSTNFEVGGVQVDIRAANAEAARSEGWRRAQILGWRILWARTHNRPIDQAPDLPESTLSGLVSGIIIEQEQIGPTRYIARLGVMFDRARTGQLLGVSGQITRSAPMLLIPVMVTGSSSYSFEFRNLWQRAWAEYRTAGSTIDYVRTAGRGIDPLLLNYPQTQRRGRGWWRLLLDQYGAADILIAEVDLRRLYPGGPATGIFTARYGPDGTFLGRFVLRAANSSAIRTMFDEGVRRIDGLYRQALAQGLLRPDPSLVILAAPLPPALEEPAEETTDGNTLATAEEPTAAPATIQSFNVQVATPDAASVQRAELDVSRVGGVASAITTSLALGGTSVMNVRFAGDAAAFTAALRAQGWNVTVVNGNTLRISR